MEWDQSVGLGLDPVLNTDFLTPVWCDVLNLRPHTPILTVMYTVEWGLGFSMDIISCEAVIYLIIKLCNHFPTVLFYFGEGITAKSMVLFIFSA